MDFSVIADNLDLYGKGIVTTAYLVTLSLIAGLILAVPLGILHTSGNPAVYWPVWLYVYVFCGTPLLIQLYLIYYGASQFEAVRESFLWPVLKSPTWCALIAFTLNTGAYTTEMLRGAIETAPRGEIEAARIRDVAFRDHAAHHPARRLPSRPSGLRQRSHLHAAWQHHRECHHHCRSPGDRADGQFPVLHAL